MLTEEIRRELLLQAVDVRQNAYAPYSKYTVGAALLARKGKIFIGANVENAAYPLTMCADRAAVFNAVPQGERDFVAIAIATEDGGAPCGSCRQVLAEFGLDIQVLLIDASGELVDEMTVGDLLPKSFSSDNLDT